MGPGSPFSDGGSRPDIRAGERVLAPAAAAMLRHPGGRGHLHRDVAEEHDGHAVRSTRHTTAATSINGPSGGWNCSSTGVPGRKSPRGLSRAPLALRSTVWQRMRVFPTETHAVHETFLRT